MAGVILLLLPHLLLVIVPLRLCARGAKGQCRAAGKQLE